MTETLRALVEWWRAGAYRGSEWSDGHTGGMAYAADELEAALAQPARCDVAGMDCVHDMPERCAIHWIAEPDSQQGWADYTHRQGKFEVAGDSS